MSTLDLRENWIEEAKQWDKQGDPEYDPNIDPKKAGIELLAKEDLLKRLNEQQYNLVLKYLSIISKTDAKKLKEMEGDWAAILLVLAGFGAAFGPKAEKAVREAAEDQIIDSIANDLNDNKRVLSKFSFRRHGPGLVKRLGKAFFEKFGILATISAVASVGLSGATIWEVWDDQSEVTEKIEQLHKAIRWEQLQIDNDPSPPDAEVGGIPTSDIAEKLTNPECKLVLEITFHWIDSKTGTKHSKTIRDVILKEERSDGADEKKDRGGDEKGSRTRYSAKVPHGLGPEACFIVAEITWRLMCTTKPPVNRIIHHELIHGRSTADTSKVRGKLPF